MMDFTFHMVDFATHPFWGEVNGNRRLETAVGRVSDEDCRVNGIPAPTQQCNPRSLSV